jgi:hypothetical protein
MIQLTPNALDLTASDEKAYRFFVNWLYDRSVVFHPDTRFWEYVDRRGARTFSTKTARILDEAMLRFFKSLGDEVYEIGLEEQRKRTP